MGFGYFQKFYSPTKDLPLEDNQKKVFRLQRRVHRMGPKMFKEMAVSLAPPGPSSECARPGGEVRCDHHRCDLPHGPTLISLFISDLFFHVQIRSPVLPPGKGLCLLHSRLRARPGAGEGGRALLLLSMQSLEDQLRFRRRLGSAFLLPPLLPLEKPLPGHPAVPGAGQGLTLPLLCPLVSAEAHLGLEALEEDPSLQARSDFQGTSQRRPLSSFLPAPNAFTQYSQGNWFCQNQSHINSSPFSLTPTSLALCRPGSGDLGR